MDLFAVAAAQCGAFTTEQAAAQALSATWLRERTRRGFVQRIASGLYVVAGAPPCWEQQLWIAYLAAGPGTAVSGRAAGCALGLNGYRRQVVETLMPGGRNQRQPVGRARRTRWLPPEHIVHLPGLPPVTSVARTIFDLAGDPDRRLAFQVEQWRETHKLAIRRLISRSLRRDDFTMGAMFKVLAGLGRRGRAGTTIIRELVAELGRDYIPTDSDLEDSFLELIRSEHIEEPELQVQVSGPEGWIAKADTLFRPRINWEIDGPDHDAPLQKGIDATRDEAMRAAGYEVHRADWWRILNDQDRLIADVRASLDD